MEIKEILYTEIDKIGKNNIRTQLSGDISNSKTIINLLLNNCSNSLNNNNLYDDEFVSFSEALLHFVLTMSMIPAERKISMDNIDIDILVPNSKNLKIDNDKAIIIHFLKDGDENIDESITKLSSLQKNINNIWIVSSSSSFLKNINLDINTFIVSPFLSDTVDSNGKSIYPFSEIIVKLDEFLKKINYSGLKIF
jgi:hypothetical protein